MPDFNKLPYLLCWQGDNGYGTMPTQGLIHRRRVMLLMKQALYPQATTAGFNSYISGQSFLKKSKLIRKCCEYTKRKKRGKKVAQRRDIMPKCNNNNNNIGSVYKTD